VKIEEAEKHWKDWTSSIEGQESLYGKNGTFDPKWAEEAKETWMSQQKGFSEWEDEKKTGEPSDWESMDVGARSKIASGISEEWMSKFDKDYVESLFERTARSLQRHKEVGGQELEESYAKAGRSPEAYLAAKEQFETKFGETIAGARTEFEVQAEKAKQAGGLSVYGMAMGGAEADVAKSYGEDIFQRGIEFQASEGALMRELQKYLGELSAEATIEAGEKASEGAFMQGLGTGAGFLLGKILGF
jgi:hypothetical protein